MSKDQIAEDIWEFRAEAAKARQLAATFEGGPAVTDLLNYASALDREAAQLEKASWEFLPSSLAKPDPTRNRRPYAPKVRARSYAKVSTLP